MSLMPIVTCHHSVSWASVLCALAPLLCWQQASVYCCILWASEDSDSSICLFHSCVSKTQDPPGMQRSQAQLHRAPVFTSDQVSKGPGATPCRGPDIVLVFDLSGVIDSDRINKDSVTQMLPWTLGLVNA